MLERDDVEDLRSTLKALSAFRTMRTNLALFSSFARQSGIGAANYSGEDLGFLGVEPGEGQRDVHNRAITTLLTALITQALRNYFELKDIKPRLEDPDLEQFLARLGDGNRFFSGMTKVRNAVFHVKGRRAWRDRDVVFLGEILQQRIETGGPNFMEELSVLLYDFTQKCFMGDLKFWPVWYYETHESLSPELRARMDAGEASFEEAIGAFEQSQNRG